MKKKWIILGIVLLLIFFALLIIVFGNIIYTVESSIKEVSEKQKKIRNSEIEMVILNEKKLASEKVEKIVILIKKINFNPNQGRVRVGKKNYNNTLKFITTDNEEIEYNFYFSKKCWNNMVMVEKGMMDIEVEELCEELDEDKNIQ